MIDKNFKIGFSEIGGIYIGKNIKSNFHKHYSITIIISFGEAFKLTTTEQILPSMADKQDLYKVAITQKNISYNLQSPEDDFIAIMHIVPYSEIGINLSNNERAIQKFNIKLFKTAVIELKNWFTNPENDPIRVKNLLNLISDIPQTSNNKKVIIDERIRRSFDLIMNSESEKLPINQIAKSLYLSPSHFARLFKKETGMTFREFVLNSKLIKSIYAMYKNNSLTEAAFLGGFADQPHFTRTFKNAFGIKPSSSRK